MLTHVLVGISLLSSLVFGNVEKTIFSAPDLISLPTDASIDNLYLTSLNPDHLTARTLLDASFPTDTNPRGSESWLLLEGLNPGQRYEVRICWLATQPTSFWLFTHKLSNTMDSAGLITSLSSYASSRRDHYKHTDLEQLQTRRWSPRHPSNENSVLFLQIHAAADYFTLDTSLMENVPPVMVDIILDPYILNIVPQSLIPTIVYIIAIALMAWFLSTWIAVRLFHISGSISTAPNATKKVE